MTSTYIIGQPFLVRDWLNRSYHSNLVFYGCNKVNNDHWKANICKEIGDFSGIIEENISGAFCIDVQVGDVLRFYDYYIYIQKNNKIGFRSEYFTDNRRGRRSVESIKILDLGQDFITIEYKLR